MCVCVCCHFSLQFSSKYPAVKIVTSSQLSSTITEVGKPIFWSVTLKGQVIILIKG